ncbi:MAG: AMP-binding protein, partial [Planctomycetota bacterium]
MSTSSGDIESVLKEARVFEPPKEFAEKAHIGSLEEYETLYRRSVDDPEGFWGEQAETLHWFQKWNRVLEWEAPNAKWFLGGTTNVAFNCLDRHLTTHRRNKAAIIWEGEPGDQRVLTYDMLHAEVCRTANAMKSLGVGKGDRVIVYMPMVPELAITILACARIGATHSVVFGGFSAQALIDRIGDCEASFVVTADGGWRRGKEVPLKPQVDEALAACPSVRHSLVLKRTGSNVTMKSGRDVWWHDVVPKASLDCPAEELDSEHPLYILYTSGTTGKPKGIVHSTGGYLLGASLTAKYVFDLKDEDVYWCTADIGWVTGHSYIVYGILANGATSLMYEGAPNHPGPDRFWDMVERYRVNIFYT